MSIYRSVYNTGLQLVTAAKFVAYTYSGDSTTQVGAVAHSIRHGLLGMAGNGFVVCAASGTEGVKTPDRLERPEKYRWFTHAEERLVAQLAEVPSLPMHWHAGIWGNPCTRCARLLMESGCGRVCVPSRDTGPFRDRSDWDEDLVVAEQMLQEFLGDRYEVIHMGDDT